MVKYLQMDGVDDYLVTPSVTFDKIVMEFSVDASSANSNLYIVDARSGSNLDASAIGTAFSYVTKSSMMLYRNPGILSMKVDGVLKDNQVLVSNHKYVVEYGFKPVNDPAVEFFISNARSGTQATKGSLYSIVGYNGASVVFNYDMSTGTVQDQSGNGNHAILTGGTWINDGPASTPESTAFATKQVIYQNDSVSFPMVQNFIETSAAESNTFQTRQLIYTLDTQSFSTRQRIANSDIQTFPYLLRIYSTDTEVFPMLQIIDTGLPTFESAEFPFRTFIHNMLVIEHDITGERFMFPRHNVNKETYEGFIQFQVVPRGFHLSDDQSPVPIIYMNDNTQTELVRWEANSKDPINTMEKWGY